MTSTPSILPRSGPSLWSLTLAACSANPSDPLFSAVSEHSYSTLFSLVPVPVPVPVALALAVLRVAAEVEPCPKAVMQWYRHTPIWELGNLPAERLVALGRAEMVIAFLRSIRDGARN